MAFFMNSLKGARSGPDNRIKGARIAAMTKILGWRERVQTIYRLRLDFPVTLWRKKTLKKKPKLVQIATKNMTGTNFVTSTQKQQNSALDCVKGASNVLY